MARELIAISGNVNASTSKSPSGYASSPLSQTLAFRCAGVLLTCSVGIRQDMKLYESY